MRILFFILLFIPLCITAQTELIGLSKADIEKTITFRKSFSEAKRLNGGKVVEQMAYILGKSGDYHIVFVDNVAMSLTFEPTPKPLLADIMKAINTDFTPLKQVEVDRKQYEGSMILNNITVKIRLVEYIPTGRITKISIL